MSDWTSEADELRAENERLREENRLLQRALEHAVAEFVRRPSLLERWRNR